MQKRKILKRKTPSDANHGNFKMREVNKCNCTSKPLNWPRDSSKLECWKVNLTFQIREETEKILSLHIPKVLIILILEHIGPTVPICCLYGLHIYAALRSRPSDRIIDYWLDFCVNDKTEFNLLFVHPKWLVLLSFLRIGDAILCDKEDLYGGFNMQQFALCSMIELGKQYQAFKSLVKEFVLTQGRDLWVVPSIIKTGNGQIKSQPPPSAHLHNSKSKLQDKIEFRNEINLRHWVETFYDCDLKKLSTTTVPRSTLIVKCT